jgi:hypothetical protein
MIAANSHRCTFKDVSASIPLQSLKPKLLLHKMQRHHLKVAPRFKELPDALAHQTLAHSSRASWHASGSGAERHGELFQVEDRKIGQMTKFTAC